MLFIIIIIIITMNNDEYFRDHSLPTIYVCTNVGVTPVNTVDLYDSVTASIPFGAHPSVVAEALSNVGKIKRRNPQIFVYRESNQFNAFTYKIEIHGMPDLPVLYIYSNTLQLSHGGSCWTSDSSPQITTKMTQEAEDVFVEENTTVEVHGLRPQVEYSFRLQHVHHESLDITSRRPSDIVTGMTLSIAEDIENRKQLEEAQSPANRELKGDHRHFDEKPGHSLLREGKGIVPGNDIDFFYQRNVGMGGLSGEDGHHGLCVAIEYNPRSNRPYSHRRFYYIGAEVDYQVAHGTSVYGSTQLITFKCWGGGGGGGATSKYLSNQVNRNPDFDVNIVEDTMNTGGAGGYAQTTISVQEGDMITVLVGGGGKGATGDRGGKGGFGYGADGGDGSSSGGGGGGGGGSIVTKNKRVVLAAGGGGGGGATDYCCSSGGVGGGTEGGAGVSPKDATPWPLDATHAPTPLNKRPFVYTSGPCIEELGIDATTGWCISEWDTLPNSLPVEHVNLQYGHSPDQNYSAWAEAGEGGQTSHGGLYGSSGHYNIAGSVPAIATASMGARAVYIAKPSLYTMAQSGKYLLGGRGASGREGGGGGGGGYYGGGGGGSGIDAGGGGGGSGYIDPVQALYKEPDVLSSTATPVLDYINTTHAVVSWRLKWHDTIWGMATGYDLEIAHGPYSEDFERFDRIKAQRLVFKHVFKNFDDSNILFLLGQGIHRTLMLPMLCNIFNQALPIVYA